MLSNPQKALLKQAQRQAGLDDAEYREALQVVTGCTSSTDPRIGDDQFDVLLAYFEAIFWRKVDKGELQPPCNSSAVCLPKVVFVRRGYWAAKNSRQENSRDRYAYATLTVAIESLESELAAMGYGPEYCASIRRRATSDQNDVRALHSYRAALEKTLRSKRKGRVEQPF